MNVGIFGFQGDIEEHINATRAALREMGGDGTLRIVKRPQNVAEVDCLIIPGGESTVMGSLASINQTLESVRGRASEGMPVWGTCAGLIMIAKKTYDRVLGETKQPLLGLMDVVVERNSFGRQRESFEVELDVPVLGEKKFRAVFIRAPSVREAGKNVKVLAGFNNTIVAVREGNLLGTCFHPELSGDLRFHKYFLELAARMD